MIREKRVAALVAFAVAAVWLCFGCGGGGLSQFDGIGLDRTKVKVAREETQDVVVKVHQVPGESTNGTTTFSIAGLPSGLTASFDPPSLTLNGTDIQTTTLHVTPARLAQVGTYNVTVRRTSGHQTFDERLTLRVVDFAVGTDLDTSSVTLNPGDSQDVNITLTRRGNSDGTVEMELGGNVPDGVSYSFSPSRVQIDSTHTRAHVKLTFDADSSATNADSEECHVKSLKGINEDDSGDITVDLQIPATNSFKARRKSGSK